MKLFAKFTCALALLGILAGAALSTPTSALAASTKKPAASSKMKKGTVHVKGYTRVTKSGKVVKVKAYTRHKGKMSAKKTMMKMAPSKMAPAKKSTM